MAAGDRSRALAVSKAGDELIVLGPTAALERLSRGELVADEAAAHAAIDGIPLSGLVC